MDWFIYTIWLQCTLVIFLHSKLVTQKCSGVKQASRGRGMCVCTCVWRSEVDIGYLLWLLSMLYFGQSLTELRTHRFGCTDWPASPRGSSCPGFPHDGIIGICHYAQCFMLVLEIELWFSCLYSKAFYQLTRIASLETNYVWSFEDWDEAVLFQKEVLV